MSSAHEDPERAKEPIAPGAAAARAQVGRIGRFAIVGIIGVGVNQGLLMLLHGSFGVSLAIASAIAIEASILGNFVLNSRWTWAFDFGGSARLWLRRCAEYHVSALVAAFVGNYLVLLGLVYLFGMDYRIANLFGIAAGSAVNYLAGELWIFRRRGAGEEGEA